MMQTLRRFSEEKRKISGSDREWMKKGKKKGEEKGEDMDTVSFNTRTARIFQL